MSRLLLPDAGPLFSFAAGEILDVLLEFDLVISDVIKMETIDRGLQVSASFESILLSDFYAQHQERIRVEPTQVGHLSDGMAKRHAGELSIQSMMIHLEHEVTATVLFEDKWFVRNRRSFPPSCVLMTTVAFLGLLEEVGMIPSAAQAEAKIRLRRPHFQAERWVFTGGLS